MTSLSVIVPAHDDEPTIVSAMQSALDAARCFGRSHREVRDRVEVIVVDDGSRDGTLSAALDFTHGKNLFRVFHRRNASSPATAQNFGATQATGELLFFLDADDVYLENHLFECCRAFLKTRRSIGSRPA